MTTDLMPELHGLTQREWDHVRDAALKWVEQVKGGMPGPEPLLGVVALLRAKLPGRTTASGDDGPCQVCDQRYPAWRADNALWNLVMGGPEATGDPGGMLCPVCFLRLADERAPSRGAWVVGAPVRPESVVKAELMEALASDWRLLRHHHPVGSYYPVGQLDGDCSCGRGAWPCDTVRAVVRSA